jgi:RNA polymerase sigma-70 factor, ECF subfamily
MLNVSDIRHPDAGRADPEDSVLLERIRRRDEAALESLIKRYAKLLRNIVGRMISNEQDVSDVIGEVFLSIWNQASNFDAAKGEAIGWIVTIARRRAIDRVRRRQAYHRAQVSFSVSRQIGASHIAGDDVEKSALKSETAATFQTLLSTLPAAQSAMVRMTFYRGLSNREIARETGIPLGTVKTRIELGLKKLRARALAICPRTEWLSGTA